MTIRKKRPTSVWLNEKEKKLVDVIHFVTGAIILYYFYSFLFFLDIFEKTDLLPNRLNYIQRIVMTDNWSLREFNRVHLEGHLEV